MAMTVIAFTEEKDPTVEQITQPQTDNAGGTEDMGKIQQIKTDMTS